MNLLGFPCRFSTIQKNLQTLIITELNLRRNQSFPFGGFAGAIRLIEPKIPPHLNQEPEFQQQSKVQPEHVDTFGTRYHANLSKKKNTIPLLLLKVAVFLVLEGCVFWYTIPPPQMTLRPPDHDHPIPWLWAFHGSHQGNGAKRHCRTINQSTEDSRDEIWPLRTVVTCGNFGQGSSQL